MDREKALLAAAALAFAVKGVGLPFQGFWYEKHDAPRIVRFLGNCLAWVIALFVGAVAYWFLVVAYDL